MAFGRICGMRPLQQQQQQHTVDVKDRLCPAQLAKVVVQRNYKSNPI